MREKSILQSKDQHAGPLQPFDPMDTGQSDAARRGLLGAQIVLQPRFESGRMGVEQRNLLHSQNIVQVAGGRGPQSRLVKLREGFHKGRLAAQRLEKSGDSP